MSMKQAKGKQTKGKQKIEMKKVEAHVDRLITFSKRKSGIYKKVNEIISLCGVEVAFLVFSQAGKPYSFANPSMEKMAERLKNHSRSEPFANDDNNNTGPLVEAYKKKKTENLSQKHMEVLKELDMEEEKVKLWKKSENKEEVNKMWWDFTPENVTVEEIELKHRPFVELFDQLCNIAISKSKNGEGSSSGRRGHCGGGEA